MEDQRIRKIVISGVLSAIAILLGITRLGFIPWIGGAALTVMHVPVIIGAIIEGPIVGMVIGLLFGLFSLIQAAVAPTGPIDIAFTNPVISILPRILIGITSWLAYRGLKKRHEAIAIIIASIVGSLTNTVLVMGFLGVFQYVSWAIVALVSASNGIPEAIAAALLGTAIVLSWKKIHFGRKKSNLPEIEENDVTGN